MRKNHKNKIFKDF